MSIRRSGQPGSDSRYASGVSSVRLILAMVGIAGTRTMHIQLLQRNYMVRRQDAAALGLADRRLAIALASDGLGPHRAAARARGDRPSRLGRQGDERALSRRGAADLARSGGAPRICAAHGAAH